jgi:small subunit ribosomal protein S20
MLIDYITPKKSLAIAVLSEYTIICDLMLLLMVCRIFFAKCIEQSVFTKWGELMANIKSAKKRIKVIEAKTQRNRRVKAHLKAVLKNFDLAVANGDQETARDKLALAEKKLMQAAAKGTVHKNSASRKVSRITLKFKQAFGQEALLVKANKPAPPDPAEKQARKDAKLALEEEKKAKAARPRKQKSPVKSTKVASVEEAEATAEISEETPEISEETPEVVAEEAEAPAADAVAPESEEAEVPADAPEETPEA